MPFWVDDKSVNNTYKVRDCFGELVQSFSEFHAGFSNPKNQSYFHAIADTLILFLENCLNVESPPDQTYLVNLLNNLGLNLFVTRKLISRELDRDPVSVAKQALVKFSTIAIGACERYREDDEFSPPGASDSESSPSLSLSTLNNNFLGQKEHKEQKEQKIQSAYDLPKLLRLIDQMRYLPWRNLPSYADRFVQLFHRRSVQSDLSKLGLGSLLITGVDWCQKKLTDNIDTFDQGFDGFADPRVWAPIILFSASILLTISNPCKNSASKQLKEPEQQLEPAGSTPSVLLVASDSELDEEAGEFKILTPKLTRLS